MKLMLVLAALFLAAGLALATATETTWNGDLGDWGEATNWSDGEPTIDCAAIVPEGVVNINQAGEVCSDLRLGDGALPLGSAQMISGDLTVSGQLIMSGGTMAQFSGDVDVGRMQVGAGETGGYTLGGGTLDIGTLQLGAPQKTGSFGGNAGQITVTDSLILEIGGGFSISGFNVDADLPLVIVRGGFSVANGSRPILADTFTMEGTGRLLAGMGVGAVSVITVDGTATLAGTLQIQDNSNIVNGTYEFIRAGTLAGTFDSFVTPGPEWTWFTENNSLFLRKGDPTPVEGTSWGQIKNRWSPFGNQPKN